MCASVGLFEIARWSVARLWKLNRAEFIPQVGNLLTDLLTVTMLRRPVWLELRRLPQILLVLVLELRLMFEVGARASTPRESRRCATHATSPRLRDSLCASTGKETKGLRPLDPRPAGS